MTSAKKTEDQFNQTRATLRKKLLHARKPHSIWEGKLSSSALSTATAICALSLANQRKDLVNQGIQWLKTNINPDGGWGDTTISNSNISTTLLVWAAFAAAGHKNDPILKQTENWIGDLSPKALAAKITECYGNDKTFSIPILTMCALAGGLGENPWPLIKPLPFEFAAAPHSWLKLLKLTVVSYALPALIAIGQVRHHKLPPKNPFTRLLRNLLRTKTLNLLTDIQPQSGGFLEAAPLTSFVAMSLIASDQKDHPVVKKALNFLETTVRKDGSWPIDTNLSTWVTTLSVNSLALNPEFHNLLPEEDRITITRRLLDQQTATIHPYTRAEPGGWAWTELSGGVPDGDDTAGAILALHHLGVEKARTQKAVTAGANWLINLQNSDGGIPTFCSGWGKLPFDQSCPDLTAHAIWALNTALNPIASKQKQAIKRMLSYLEKAQKPNGSWIPLWFGNQDAPNQENPVYGTAKVLCGIPTDSAMAKKGAEYLVSAQNPDGGWGGAPMVPSTIEETAAAVSACAEMGKKTEALKGADWLVTHTNQGQDLKPASIGLYFARLWYYEDLYPLTFALSALERIKRLIP